MKTFHIPRFDRSISFKWHLKEEPVLGQEIDGCIIVEWYWKRGPFRYDPQELWVKVVKKPGVAA